MSTVESRLRQLEAREQIRELAVRYGLAVDDRDFAALRDLFTPDAALLNSQGVKGRGRDAVVAYFENHLPNLGPTNHFVHGHVVELDDGDDGLARGVVTAHAEVWRDGTPMITAMRYLDVYRVHDGAWRFHERVQSYMYFTDVRDYPEVLGSRLRIRTSKDDPKPADWPANV